MSGTAQGGRAARDTNLELQGPNFYKRIGSIGGSRGKADGAIKGFAQNHELAVSAGRKGGMISKRGPMPEQRKNELRDRRLYG